MLEIAPSTYYSRAARAADPETRPDRWWRDRALEVEVQRVWEAEVIHRRSWRNREQVELATLDSVHWFNHKRLPGLIGHVRPAEAEAAYYLRQAGQAKAA